MQSVLQQGPSQGWEDFGISILANLASDVIFLVLVAAIAGVLVYLLRRRPIQSFFGVQDSKRLVIYLSNLTVAPGGSRGADNQSLSYQGLAVSFHELVVANKIRDLFSYPLPSFGDKPGILSKFLVSDVQVQIAPAPLNPEKLEYSMSFVSLGSPGYNTASRFLERQAASLARFTSSNQTMAVEGIQPESNTSYGFVERIYDADKKRCLFYVAGISELGTVGAAHYLATQWRALRRKYGDKKNFVVMLGVEPSDYTRSTEVYAKEGPERRIVSLIEDKAAQGEVPIQESAEPTIMTTAGPMPISTFSRLKDLKGPTITTSGAPPTELRFPETNYQEPYRGGTAIPTTLKPEEHKPFESPEGD